MDGISFLIKFFIIATNLSTFSTLSNSQKILAPSIRSQSLLSSSIVSFEPSPSRSLTTLNSEPSRTTSMLTLSSIQTEFDTLCVLSQASIIPLCLREKSSTSLACFLLEDLLLFDANGACKSPFKVTIRNCTRYESSSKSLLSRLDKNDTMILKDNVTDWQNSTFGLELHYSSNLSWTHHLFASTENLTKIATAQTYKHRRHKFAVSHSLARGLTGISRRYHQSLLESSGEQPRRVKGIKLIRKLNSKQKRERKRSKSSSLATSTPNNSHHYTKQMIPSLNVVAKRSRKKKAKRMSSIQGKKVDFFPSKTKSSPSVSNQTITQKPTRLVTPSMMKSKKKMSNDNVQDQGKKKEGKGKRTFNPSISNGNYPINNPPMQLPNNIPVAPSAPITFAPKRPKQIRMSLAESDCDAPCVVNDAKDRVCFGATAQGSAVAVTTISYTVTDSTGVTKLLQLDVVITDDRFCTNPLSTCRLVT
jgi:hypothetical protein